MRIDAAAVTRYHEDGFLVVPNLFSAEEVRIMLDHVGGEKVAGQAWDITDASGAGARMALWTDIAQDVWGAASTCPRIVNTIRMLQGEDIAFFHGKVMLKLAGTGAAFEWHQDYGYWYDQGFAMPRMMSAFVALDPCTRANGCLEVLKGSHRLGRLNHQAAGSQTGADPERLRQVMPLFEHVHVELTPGSTIFFDCNLLHGSSPNRSTMHRRSFIMCYNALHNPTLWPNHPLLQVPCPVGPENGLLQYAPATA